MDPIAKLLKNMPIQAAPTRPSLSPSIDEYFRDPNSIYPEIGMGEALRDPNFGRIEDSQTQELAFAPVLKSLGRGFATAINPLFENAIVSILDDEITSGTGYPAGTTTPKTQAAPMPVAPAVAPELNDALLEIMKHDALQQPYGVTSLSFDPNQWNIIKPLRKGLSSLVATFEQSEMEKDRVQYLLNEAPEFEVTLEYLKHHAPGLEFYSESGTPEEHLKWLKKMQDSTQKKDRFVRRVADALDPGEYYTPGGLLGGLDSLLQHTFSIAKSVIETKMLKSIFGKSAIPARVVHKTITGNKAARKEAYSKLSQKGMSFPEAHERATDPWFNLSDIIARGISNGITIPLLYGKTPSSNGNLSPFFRQFLKVAGATASSAAGSAVTSAIGDIQAQDSIDWKKVTKEAKRAALTAAFLGVTNTVKKQHKLQEAQREYKTGKQYNKAEQSPESQKQPPKSQKQRPKIPKFPQHRKRY